ncbi:MFS general substrate transporter [Anaeromyces robustus]|uniref:MFS general substrate transporter n=1 Tax=Anaeromyces robustus TaxID=1754192 RepID=A0A1Y1XKQ2_9FUNG|nr:MFS general substrate transporter [Anaeromyces robustus]|eukprot:ORX86273.1 MFS general substrate transporter [Anaeromyces robustus]
MSKENSSVVNNVNKDIDITSINSSNSNSCSIEIRNNQKDTKIKSNKPEIDPNYATYKLPKKQFFCVIISLLISLSMASLDITVVATTLPSISKEFNSQENYTWVILAYLLGNTSFSPTCGKLADIFGRRPVMLFVLSIFLISSVICSVSKSFNMIVAARAFQGTAGGSLISMSNIICADIVSIKQRGTYLGLLNSIFSLTMGIGPLVGGLFTDFLSWRWAFYINIPLCLIAMTCIGLFVKIPIPPAAIVCLLLGLNWGGTTYEWTSSVILGLFGAFLVLICCFLFVEYKIAKEPIIPFHLFKINNLRICAIMSIMAGLIFITFNNVFSMLYQNGRGFSATKSGLRIIPAFITIALSSVGSGWLIEKYGHIKEFTIIGAFLLFFCCYSLSFIGEHTPFYVEAIIYLIYGFCISIPLQFSLVIAQISAPSALSAVSTAVTLFFRMIGGVLGVAIFGMVVKNKFSSNYKKAYPNIQHVSVNDLKTLENAPYHYIKAVNFSYIATFLPPAVIIFIFSFLLTKLKFKSKKVLDKQKSSEEELVKEPIKEVE